MLTVDLRFCARCPAVGLTEEDFSRIRQPITGGVVRSGTCKRCIVAKMKAGHDAHFAEQAAERAKKIRCGACGDDKHPRAFALGGSGKPVSPCKDCKKRNNRLYRSTPEGLRARDKYLKSGKHLACARRWRAKVGKNRRREKSDAHKAYNMLQESLRNGSVVRPEKCRVCRRKRFVVAHLKAGPSRPMERAWLCKRCAFSANKALRSGVAYAAWLSVNNGEAERARAAVARKTAARYGCPAEVADRLSVTPEDFREIHEAHVRALANEPPAPPERFAPLLAPGQFHYDRAPRAEGAERFLMMALGMEA